MNANICENLYINLLVVSSRGMHREQHRNLEVTPSKQTYIRKDMQWSRVRSSFQIVSKYFKLTRLTRNWNNLTCTVEIENCEQFSNEGGKGNCSALSAMFQLL